jgi:ribosomal protein S18 acetylase RimI-like enzyme
MPGSIRPLTIADYDAVIALWRASEGVVLRGADSREGIARFLAHNPGLSFAHEEGGVVLGAVLGGTDGRRGYLHHLAVHPAARRRGIGRALALEAAAALEARGIAKCHVFVLVENAAARAFWPEVGWRERPEILEMSRTAPGREEA